MAGSVQLCAVLHQFACCTAWSGWAVGSMAKRKSTFNSLSRGREDDKGKMLVIVPPQVVLRSLFEEQNVS